ncbi:MAG TPA: DUF1614 domain-containing protein [Firmicutes bacterium]|jgi:uncharacterized membrane protein|nr:DUF1614 domain-containing protein [Bacillota bacterium]
MRSNSLAITILILLLALIYLGFLERVLERMRLTRKQAIFILLAMALGSGLPAIPLAEGLEVNLGGMAIPLIIVIYLVATADDNTERLRVLIATAVTVIAVFFTDRLFTQDPDEFFLNIDPLYFPALVAAIVAYALGRSRRASFISAFLGVLLVDFIAWGENLLRGLKNITIILGGGGVFGAAVLSGMLAVLLAETVGEIRERLHRT